MSPELIAQMLLRRRKMIISIEKHMLLNTDDISASFCLIHLVARNKTGCAARECYWLFLFSCEGNEMDLCCCYLFGHITTGIVGQ